jgi:hypothetical protein
LYQPIHACTHARMHPMHPSLSLSLFLSPSMFPSICLSILIYRFGVLEASTGPTAAGQVAGCSTTPQMRWRLRGLSRCPPLPPLPPSHPPFPPPFLPYTPICPSSPPFLACLSIRTPSLFITIPSRIKSHYISLCLSRISLCRSLHLSPSLCLRGLSLSLSQPYYIFRPASAFIVFVFVPSRSLISL